VSREGVSLEKLVDLLKKEAVSLDQDFRQASTLGEGTPQEIADFRENAFRSFIRRFFPNPYRVVKGKIYDFYENGPSASIDCVLVNPTHPNLIDTGDKFQLLLADGVDLVIEVKPDLANASELKRALEQGLSVKKLRRIKSPILLSRNKPAYVIEASKQIPFFIFTQKVKSDLEKTVHEIISWYVERSVPVEEQLDAIAILGVGILNHIKYKDFYYYGWDIPDNERFGWFLEEWHDATLIGFLLCMEMSFHSTATIQESVLRRYLKKLQIPHVRRIAT
jgi:hypothetical protein